MGFAPVDAAAGCTRLAALAARALAEPWSAATIALHGAPPAGLTLSDPGLARGLAILRLAGEEAEIVDIGILPELRRQGLGRTLLEACLAAAATRGARRMLLEVAVDNRPARALYAAAGFDAVGRRRGYYARAHGAADALVLARPLTRAIAPSGGCG